MLAVFRRKAEECGIASRCEYHEGYLDSLPPSELFDAATSILASQFVLDPAARTGFFRPIADRLRPGGILVNADLAADIATEGYRSLFEVWLGRWTCRPRRVRACVPRRPGRGRAAR